MNFRGFGKYAAEAAMIFEKNIISIFFMRFILEALVIVGVFTLSILSPDIASIFSGDPEIVFAYFITRPTIHTVYAFLSFIIYALLRSSVVSIYSFYITFKEDESGITLFFSLLRQYFWRVTKANLIAFIRIAAGCLCLFIPGIVLYFRYVGISYFVLSENVSFTKAREKSTQAMVGLKFSLFGFMFMVLQLHKLTNGAHDLITNNFPDINAAINLIIIIALAAIASSITSILYSIIVYVICLRAGQGKYFKLSLNDNKIVSTA